MDSFKNFSTFSLRNQSEHSSRDFSRKSIKVSSRNSLITSARDPLWSFFKKESKISLCFLAFDSAMTYVVFSNNSQVPNNSMDSSKVRSKLHTRNYCNSYFSNSSDHFYTHFFRDFTRFFLTNTSRKYCRMIAFNTFWIIINSLRKLFKKNKI